MQPAMIADPQPPIAPRGVAASGIVFSVLFATSIVLVRWSVPADPMDTGEWLTDSGLRSWVHLGLQATPLTGIAFLWFMASLRNRIGPLEDRFLATVFLGSGLLFVGLLFLAAALSSAVVASVLEDQSGRMSLASQRETYRFVRDLIYLLMNVFAIKMAAVFTFVTSSIGMRTGFLPRTLAWIGFVVGGMMLLIITRNAWIVLVFPLWVALLSVYILASERRGEYLSLGVRAG